MHEVQAKLEEQMRANSLKRYSENIEHDFQSSEPGSFLTKNYIRPVSDAIIQFVSDAGLGKPGRQNSQASRLSAVDPDIAAYIAVRVVLTRIMTGGRTLRELNRTALTNVAITIGRAIDEELAIQRFEREVPNLLKKITKDFDARELPEYKRREYLQKTFSQRKMEYLEWTPFDHMHVGTKLIEIICNTTGDFDVVEKRLSGAKHSAKYVVPMESLLASVERIKEVRGTLTSIWTPMVCPPRKWTRETLDQGGYLTHNVSPYHLVKRSSKEYREMLKDAAAAGQIDDVLDAINAIQETPWQIDKRVLDALQWVYDKNIECGKLPKADFEKPPKWKYSDDFNLYPKDHPERIEYMQQRAKVHEKNRRSIGKRVLAIRTLQAAKDFSQYERIYFPHDLDSRGRAYPKPYPLSPQGPDFIKGLLKFSEGKALGVSGLYWLGVHGANCYGEDKLYLDDRAKWSHDNRGMIKSIAKDPKADTRWVEADSPVQFLAFCFEYAEALDVGPEYVSHLHVDLDATCSGLQHFSAMLRDEVGGRMVNLVPGLERQDVYQAVADVSVDDLVRDAASSSDTAQLSEAWLKSAFMDRKATKRPVMVKPYAGTMSSCLGYVRDSVHEKLSDGAPLPWAEDDMFSFEKHGGTTVWHSIPKVVVAADKAMKWISKISRIASSAEGFHHLEWTTPAGFPVWQRKVNLKTRRIATYFNGSIIKPNIAEETDDIDPRKMASATAPSFVHSMDAAHLQLTTKMAIENGITNFAMVHDSFGTHAADIDIFSKIIREAFVSMYQADVLREFYDNNTGHLEGEQLAKLPDYPEQGSLDLEGVLDSEFFFS